MTRALAAALALALAAAARPASGADADLAASEISRDVENPLGREWFVKLQSNTYLLDAGDFSTHRLEPTLKIQPRISVPLTGDWLLVTRPSFVAFESKPYEDAANELARAEGIGDLELPIALAPALGPSWIAGAGPTFVLPTASNRETGQGKWQAGPAAVVGWQNEDWLFALFAQQWWSFAGSSERSRVSHLEVQYFLTRYLDDGWSVGMSPTISVDWKAASGQQLTFPVGLGASKVVKLSDGSSVKLSLQLEYMPIHPDELGREANVQVTLTPVAPQPFDRPIFGARRAPAAGALAAQAEPALAQPPAAAFTNATTSPSETGVRIPRR